MDTAVASPAQACEKCGQPTAVSKVPRHGQVVRVVGVVVAIVGAVALVAALYDAANAARVILDPSTYRMPSESLPMDGLLALAGLVVLAVGAAMSRSKRIRSCGSCGYFFELA